MKITKHDLCCIWIQYFRMAKLSVDIGLSGIALIEKHGAAYIANLSISDLSELAKREANKPDCDPVN